MQLNKLHYSLIAIVVILLGTFFVYNSFEARFNTDPLTDKLSMFRNTKHFNISVFGKGLGEHEVMWLARNLEAYYDQVTKQFGPMPAGKEWVTIYIAEGFLPYYNATGENVCIPTSRVQDRDLRFILIKTAHVLTGTYDRPWHKDHIAVEGVAAYCADQFLRRRFTLAPALEKQAQLYKLDNERYFVWKQSEDFQHYVYGKAGAFIRYVIDRYGIDKLKQLLANKGEGWKEIYGSDLHDLESRWLSGL